MAEKFTWGSDARPLENKSFSWGADVQPVSLNSPAQDQAPVTPEASLYQKLRDEMDEYGFADSLTLGFTGRGARGSFISSKETPDEDIEAIAAQHGVDAKELRSLAPFYGSIPENADAGDTAKGFVGLVSEGVGFGVPQFVYKKLQSNPKMREALDDVRELSQGRRGAALGLATGISGLVTGGAAAGGTKLLKPGAKELAKASGVGATAGLAGSREGQEVSGTLLGAGLGVGASLVPSVVKGASKGVRNLFKNEVKTADDITRYLETNAHKFDELGEQLWSEVEESEKLIQRELFQEEPKFTDSEAIQVATQQLGKTVDDYTSPQAAQKDALKAWQAARAEFVKSLSEENEAIIRSIPEEARGDDFITLNAMQRLGKNSDSPTEYLPSRFLSERKTQRLLDRISSEGLELPKHQAPIFRKFFNAFSNQGTRRVIDEVSGTSLELLGHEADKGIQRVGLANIANQQALKDVYKLAQQNKLTKELRNVNGGQLYDFLTGKTNKLDNPQLEELATRIRTVANEFREAANRTQASGEAGLSVPYKENWLPEMAVEPLEYVTRMHNKLNEVEAELGKKVSDLSKEEVELLLAGHQNFQDFFQGIALINGMPSQAVDGKQLMQKFLKTLNRGATNPKLQVVANSALPREGKIPEFLKDKHVLRLLDRYQRSLSRSIYLRKPLEDMARVAKILRAAGDGDAADWVERSIRDTVGVNENSLTRLGNAIRVKATNMLDKKLTARYPDFEERQQALRMINLMPEFLANIQYSIYPNVLAYNPRVIFQNLTQTLFKTAPEMGGTYGYQRLITAAPTVMNRLRKDAQGLIQEMKDLGIRTEPSSRAAQEMLSEELTQKLQYNPVAKGLRVMGEFGLKAYDGAEVINRATTMEMARGWARDLISGNSRAFKSLEKMPSAVRRSVQDALRAGDEQAAFKTLALYLNSATQFNYTRSSLSEFSRIAGPMLSVFTKYPLEIAGDVVNTYRTRGALKGSSLLAERIGVSYGIAALGDAVINMATTGEVAPEQEDKPAWQQTLMGKGLRASHPANALGAFVGMGDQNLPFTPIYSDLAINNVIKPLLTAEDGDEALENLGKGFSRVYETLGPGAFILKLGADTLPSLITGEKPEGTLVEKVESLVN